MAENTVMTGTTAETNELVGKFGHSTCSHTADSANAIYCASMEEALFYEHEGKKVLRKVKIFPNNTFEGLSKRKTT